MRRSKIKINLLFALTWLCGNLGGLFWLWLVWPRLEPLKATDPSLARALVVSGLVALIFPLQHSLWTQTPIKRRLLRWLGEHFERPAYVIGSALALALTAWLWRPVDAVVFRLPDWTLWPLRGLFLLAVAVQSYSAVLLGNRKLTGTAHLAAYREGRPPPPEEFRKQGLYRRIRHPAALCQIVQLWCTPVFFADRLLLAALWTLWIVAATFLEERRLETGFGETYREYKRRSGFLWPGGARRGAAR